MGQRPAGHAERILGDTGAKSAVEEVHDRGILTSRVRGCPKHVQAIFRDR
jgi:hypothetical protein